MAQSFAGALDFLKAVIPATTVVGSALRGDAAGATSRAVNLVKGAQSKPPTADQLALMGAGATPTGAGFPMWIPIAGLGVVALLLLMKKKGRR